MNAVAVVDLSVGAVTGYLPVGWYPTTVLATPDGKQLFIANAKGVAVRNPNGKPVVLHGKPVGTNDEDSKYIQNIIEGTVSIVDVPGPGGLASLTSQVLTNNRVAPNLDEKARAAFANPGMKEVIYMIKENRTYDQVLGDLTDDSGQTLGNGDPSLTLFGKDVTPNLHALAKRFALLDNFYCCAEVSADGWQWSLS